MATLIDTLNNDTRAKALFQDLLQLEEQEKIQVSRAAMSLQDM